MVASWPLNDGTISKQNKKKQTNLAQKRTQSIKESTCMKIVAMEKQQDMPTNNFVKFCQN